MQLFSYFLPIFKRAETAPSMSFHDPSLFPVLLEALPSAKQPASFTWSQWNNLSHVLWSFLFLWGSWVPSNVKVVFLTLCFLLDETNINIEDRSKYFSGFLVIYLFLSEKKAFEVVCAFSSPGVVPHAASQTFCSSPSFSMLGWHFYTSNSYSCILALTFFPHLFLSFHLIPLKTILIFLMPMILYLTHWENSFPWIQKPTSCCFCHVLCLVACFCWDTVFPCSPFNVLTKFDFLEPQY